MSIHNTNVFLSQHSHQEVKVHRLQPDEYKIPLTALIGVCVVVRLNMVDNNFSCFNAKTYFGYSLGILQDAISNDNIHGTFSERNKKNRQFFFS